MAVRVDVFRELNTLTEMTEDPTDDDLIMVYDASASTYKKITYAKLFSDINARITVLEQAEAEA